MSQSQATSETLSEFAKLLGHLQASANRKSFATDPLATVERLGLNRELIPANMLDRLAECSYEELTVVFRLLSVSCEEGLRVELPDDGGSVCIL
jgi:hypothetical protein